ncbi:hypothetical protein DESPIG_00482 [Desulfovibrio piger ATCC 29098]|uniref:Uncharacterized protein n=1 Tax=Desulfovibrio piger ATCC 29098 TaxID=411464 RepID=B6WR02_9BACT|nr:hypothetical protein DESPIG_00482 [Desulfovibrio piger ATCC 29098]
MFAARRMEMLHAQPLRGLTAQGRHHIAEGEAKAVFQPPGIAAEASHGLDMQPAHAGAQLQRQTQQGPQTVVIDAPGHGGHQHHAQTGGRAPLHGPALDRQQIQSPRQGHGPPQRQTPLQIGAVPLQIDGIQPGLAQLSGIALFQSQPQAVAVDLQQTEVSLPGHADDGGQIVAHGGLAAGKLDIAARRGPAQTVQLKAHGLQGRIVRYSAAGRRIADGAGHIAAQGHFHQSRAGMLSMDRAQTAIIGTAVPDRRARLTRIRGRFGPWPTVETRRGDAPFRPVVPDVHGKGTVFRAGTLQKDVLPPPHIAGIQPSQADRAQALGLVQYLHIYLRHGP